MAKIEEITEILVNEIDNFEKGINKLESIHEKLKKTTVKLELQEFQIIKNELIQEIYLNKNSQQKFLSEFENNIKNANIYPKWAVIVFIVSLVISFGSIFYAYTIKQDINTFKKEAYQNGINTYDNYINEFFEKHPKTKKSFENWKKN